MDLRSFDDDYDNDVEVKLEPQISTGIKLEQPVVDGPVDIDEQKQQINEEKADNNLQGIGQEGEVLRFLRVFDRSSEKKSSSKCTLSIKDQVEAARAKLQFGAGAGSRFNIRSRRPMDVPVEDDQASLLVSTNVQVFDVESQEKQFEKDSKEDQEESESQQRNDENHEDSEMEDETENEHILPSSTFNNETDENDRYSAQIMLTREWENDILWDAPPSQTGKSPTATTTTATTTTTTTTSNSMIMNEDDKKKPRIPFASGSDWSPQVVWNRRKPLLFEQPQQQQQNQPSHGINLPDFLKYCSAPLILDYRDSGMGIDRNIVSRGSSQSDSISNFESSSMKGTPLVFPLPKRTTHPSSATSSSSSSSSAAASMQMARSFSAAAALGGTGDRIFSSPTSDSPQLISTSPSTQTPSLIDQGPGYASPLPTMLTGEEGTGAGGDDITSPSPLLAPPPLSSASDHPSSSSNMMVSPLSSPDLLSRGGDGESSSAPSKPIEISESTPLSSFMSIPLAHSVPATNLSTFASSLADWDMSRWHRPRFSLPILKKKKKSKKQKSTHQKDTNKKTSQHIFVCPYKIESKRKADRKEFSVSPSVSLKMKHLSAKVGNIVLTEYVREKTPPLVMGVGMHSQLLWFYRRREFFSRDRFEEEEITKRESEEVARNFPPTPLGERIVLPARTPERRAAPMENENEDTIRFLRALDGGEITGCLNSNLFYAPSMLHNPTHNDFLLIKPMAEFASSSSSVLDESKQNNQISNHNPNEKSIELIIRPIPYILSIGSIWPKPQGIVFAPRSRTCNTFGRKRMEGFVDKEFRVQSYIHTNTIGDAFKGLATTSIVRSVFEAPRGESKRGSSSRGTYIRASSVWQRNDSYIPSASSIVSVSAEECCCYESMMSGQAFLDSLGLPETKFSVVSTTFISAILSLREKARYSAAATLLLKIALSLPWIVTKHRIELDATRGAIKILTHPLFVNDADNAVAFDWTFVRSPPRARDRQRLHDIASGLFDERVEDVVQVDKEKRMAALKRAQAAAIPPPDPVIPVAPKRGRKKKIVDGMGINGIGGETSAKGWLAAESVMFFDLMREILRSEMKMLSDGAKIELLNGGEEPTLTMRHRKHVLKLGGEISQTVTSAWRDATSGPSTLASAMASASSSIVPSSSATQATSSPVPLPSTTPFSGGRSLSALMKNAKRASKKSNDNVADDDDHDLGSGDSSSFRKSATASLSFQFGRSSNANASGNAGSDEYGEGAGTNLEADRREFRAFITAQDQIRTSSSIVGGSGGVAEDPSTSSGSATATATAAPSSTSTSTSTSSTSIIASKSTPDSSGDTNAGDSSGVKAMSLSPAEADDLRKYLDKVDIEVNTRVIREKLSGFLQGPYPSSTVGNATGESEQGGDFSTSSSSSSPSSSSTKFRKRLYLRSITMTTKPGSGVKAASAIPEVEITETTDATEVNKLMRYHINMAKSKIFILKKTEEKVKKSSVVGESKKKIPKLQIVEREKEIDTAPRTVLTSATSLSIRIPKSSRSVRAERRKRRRYEDDDDDYAE